MYMNSGLNRKLMDNKRMKLQRPLASQRIPQPQPTQQPPQQQPQSQPTQNKVKTSNVKFSSTLGTMKKQYVSQNNTSSKTIPTNSTLKNEREPQKTLTPRINTNFKSSSIIKRNVVPVINTHVTHVTHVTPETNRVLHENKSAETNELYIRESPKDAIVDCCLKRYEPHTININKKEMEQAINFLKPLEVEKNPINKEDISSVLNERNTVVNDVIKIQKPLEDVNVFFENLRDNEKDPESEFYKDKTPKIDNIDELIKARDAMDSDFEECVNYLNNLWESAGIDKNASIDVKQNYFHYLLLGKTRKEQRELENKFKILGFTIPTQHYVSYKTLDECITPFSVMFGKDDEFMAIVLERSLINLLRPHIERLKEDYKDTIIPSLGDNKQFSANLSSLMSDITEMMQEQLAQMRPQFESIEEQVKQYSVDVKEPNSLVDIHNFKHASFAEDPQNDECSFIFSYKSLVIYNLKL